MTVGEYLKALFGAEKVEQVGPPYTHTFTPPADQYDEDGEWVAPPDPTLITVFEDGETTKDCPVCALPVPAYAIIKHRDWHRAQAESHVRALEGSEGR